MVNPPPVKNNQKRIAKETLKIIENDFITERRIHEGFTEWEKAIKKYGKTYPNSKLPIRQYFGKYQWIFTQGKHKISLVCLDEKPLRKKPNWIWEIYAYEDKELFTDIIKFKTKKEAMDYIKKLFG